MNRILLILIKQLEQRLREIFREEIECYTVSLQAAQVTTVSEPFDVENELVPLVDLPGIFKVSRVTINKWEKYNRLPKRLKIGGKVFFKRTEILELLKSS